MSDTRLDQFSNADFMMRGYPITDKPTGTEAGVDIDEGQYTLLIDPHLIRQDAGHPHNAVTVLYQFGHVHRVAQGIGGVECTLSD